LKLVQRDLPLEVEDMPLRFAALLDVLRQLAGIRVIARVAPGDDRSPSGALVPTITVTGELGDPHVQDGSISLRVGDPEGESGGLLRLPSEGLTAALSTFDGNDFFILRLELGAISVLLQDEASGAL
jgi:hypothetical protein